MNRNSDREFESRKEKILNSESIKTTSKNTYYVSSKYGNDDNDGLTENTPWKSLEKFNEDVYKIIAEKFGDKSAEIYFV